MVIKWYLSSPGDGKFMSFLFRIWRCWHLSGSGLTGKEHGAVGPPGLLFPWGFHPLLLIPTCALQTFFQNQGSCLVLDTLIFILL